MTINQDTLDHLLNRRSVSIKNLQEPAPSADDIKTILKAGARVPDHNKRVPWYFITFEGQARQDIAPLLREAYKTHDPSATDAKLDLESQRFMNAPLVIGVVSRIRQKKPQADPVGRCRLYEYMPCRTRPRLRCQLVIPVVQL